MNFRIGGLGSGMDTQGMLEQIMKAERMPLNRLIQQRQILQWKQEDYRAINKKLLNFRNTAFDMRLSSKFTVRSTTATNPDVATATPTAAALSGNYTVEVQQVATRSTGNSYGAIGVKDNGGASKPLTELFGDYFQEGDKNFIINGVNFTFDKDTFDANKDIEGETWVYLDPSRSLTATLNTINNSPAGVNLFYDSTEDKVFIATKETGKELNISGDFLKEAFKLDFNNLASNYQQGQKAKVVVNGYLLERESNEFSFAGLNLRIKETGTTTITVNQDNSRIFDNVKDFVEKYNELVTAINEKLFEERHRDYPPLTDEQREQMSEWEIKRWEERSRTGHLRSDRLLQSVLTDLRNVMGGAISGLDINMLSQIGIESRHYADRGILTINENKLRKAIEENPEKIYTLFAGDSSRGIEGLSQRLTRALDRSIGRISSEAGRSTNIVDQSFIGRSIQRLNRQIDTFEERLERLEDRYWRQFVAMEKALDQMYSQSMWLNQQLMGMFR